MDGLIFKNTLFQFLTKIITAATTLIITTLVASVLSAEGYGDFTKITTLVALFYLLVDFGFNAVYLAEKPAISFSTLVKTRLGIAAALCIVINVLAVLLPVHSPLGGGFSEVVKMGVLLYSTTLFFQAILLSASGVFQYQKDYTKLFISAAAGSLTTLAITGYVVTAGMLSVLSMIVALVAGGLLSGLMGLWLSGERVNVVEKIMPQAKHLLYKSMPLGIMLLFNLVYFRADILILSFYKSSFDVGVYGLAYRLFEFLVALPLFLSNALYPHLLEVEKNNRIFASLIKKYLTIALIMSIIIIIVFWVLSPLLALIHSDFKNAVLPFRILLVSLPIFFFTSILQWGLIAKRQQKFLLWVYLFAGVLNIVFNMQFISQYSYLASSGITGISELFVCIVLATKMMFLSKNMQNGK